MKPIFAIALLIAVSCTTANAQKPKAQKFTPKQIHAGAELYEDNCSTCHGEHMADPGMAFDLRTFPHDQHDRFVNSVSNGKNSMPAWSGSLKPEEIESLWAYVVAGEKATAKKTDAK